MKRIALLFFAVLFAVIVSVPEARSADDLANKFNDVLSQAQAQNGWQIKAADVFAMMQAKKQDFLIVDVRPVPPGQMAGKIAGSIFIPYYDLMKPENLKQLPKDKKLILACVTGQTQNLPVVPLRVLGYEAYTMSFGMTSWIRGYFGGNFMQGAIAGANYPVE
ncbi:MAG: rhodanese-like domain-containing protein [Deltaproteobacteria bacterium]|jgi:rhodanese-related sulfurtransferase|nr:rhodanese-like domain-containing protein [Deltaproteobacteria bacterium]